MEDLNIKIRFENGMYTIENLNDNSDYTALAENDLLSVLSFIYSKYGDEFQRAELIKEFIFKDKVAKYIFDNKSL